MTEESLEFLLGGGDMGARIRAKDWAKTPLGPPATWPQSLRTCVRIVLTSRQPMFVWWGDDLINLYNDAYKAILGGKHPDVLGQPASVVWREIWDQVGPRANQTMQGHEGTYDEALLLIMERNGYPEETYYTFSYSPVPNDAGGTGGIICANTDDTRRIIGERQVALLRELATGTADARKIDDAVALAAAALRLNPTDLPFALLYLLDPGGRAVLAATAGIERGHAAAPEVLCLEDENGPWPLGEVARTHQPLVVDRLAARFGALPTGAWKDPPKTAVVLPVAASGETGRAGLLVVGLNPFRAFDDDYRGFLRLVASQIAAAVANAQAYEEEKKRAESLAELDRAKTAFFSNVSHEFRTPLTLMLGPTEDALASTPQALTGENLRTVQRNALRLLKLVNALLDFSRIEAGRAQASYEPTDLAALTTDLASAFRSAIARAGLTFDVECAPLPEPVFVDHDMWEKIVLNLLSNALKFTIEGAISVALLWQGDHAELRVRDTGSGIPEKELPHVFERFHRVEATRARTQEGSGIGLALVHELVRLHGGTARVESRVGEGTTFTISIPRGSAHLPTDRLNASRLLVSTATGAAPYVEEALRWLAPEGAGGDAASAAEARTLEPVGADSFPADLDAHILLADDNADMREYVARLLRRRWTVEAVGDGAAALDAAKRRTPDLVLTDVMMPVMDGFGLLRALRAEPATSGTPVIMLSARAGEESRVEGLEAGADDYLVKPFSARELVARVTTHLQIASLRRATEAERQKLHDFLMQAPVPVAVIQGSEPRFDVANPAYCEMIGRSDVSGRLVTEVLPEIAGHPVLGVYDRVATTGEEVRATETKIPLVRGGVQRDAFFNIVARAIRGPGGAITSVMFVAIEVTEQVVARQRIDGLREAAEQASRAKDDFLGTLSHELRTPLNAIVGWSALLRNGNVVTAQLPKVLETIERNARAQARLIDDLLELSRIEQGKLVLSVGPVEMVRVVEGAIESARPAADAKGVRLQAVLDSHATIVGDADRLQQVVWNLLANAIKFTPRGGRVHVRLVREHSFVELAVADDGQGIDPDFLPHVFDRFRQADPTATRKAGGLGLGLAIVRSLVELHGGLVTASSDGPGRGAVFAVRLPTAPLRADAIKQPAESESHMPAPAFDAPAELRGLRVLVVDDEPDTRALLDYVIAQCQSTVTTAGSVGDALAALQTQRFDLLVSDVGMPGEDGYSLIRKVRTLSSEQGGRIPALALTAYARGEDRAAALKAGFDMHLAKPIDPSELLVVLARLASSHQVQGAATTTNPAASS